jgi:single-stranded-DNA-specific exonuclease
VILFSTEGSEEINENSPETQFTSFLDPESQTLSPSKIARGSARSANQIDLYQLVKAKRIYCTDLAVIPSLPD